jgi:hypothetical protein
MMDYFMMAFLIARHRHPPFPPFVVVVVVCLVALFDIAADDHISFCAWRSFRARAVSSSFVCAFMSCRSKKGEPKEHGATRKQDPGESFLATTKGCGKKKKRDRNLRVGCRAMGMVLLFAQP